MHISRSTALLSFAGLLSQPLLAQDPEAVVRTYLLDNRAKLGLSADDVEQWRVTDRSTSRTSGTTFIYIQQTANGLPVHNAVANFAVRDGRVLHVGNRLITDLSNKVGNSIPAMDAAQALRKAASQLGLHTSGAVTVLRTLDDGTLELSTSGIAHDPIKARLIYQPVGDGRVLLAWDITIRSLNGHNWWHLGVDASSGAILRNNDYIVECAFPKDAGLLRRMDDQGCMSPSPAAAPPAPDGYNVFAMPVESPNHGSRTMVSDPADSEASPFAWHDTNGATGAEYTITRGNNVHANEDFDNDDQPGYSPDGGVSLEFDFPLDFAQNPSGYLDASITNLFYWNNIMHDVWYRYGFDEESGNFQANNYGEGGDGDDYVIAEGQDGGGTNNANFASPPDGENGRMQMYNWSDGGSSDNLTINSPAEIAGVYNSPDAIFGPGIPPTPLTADVVLVVDDGAPVNDGCGVLLDPASFVGKIALVDRGGCNFTIKVQAVQDAGAVGAIVINNVAGAPINMGGTSSTITIPSVMVSQADGALIRDMLADGPVNATLQGSVTERDGCLDSGVIAHEYGHGISIRLTGGPGNSDCLQNAEQMGEGWSDWVGLMLTIESGDAGSDVRGIGTFANGQAVTDDGIRPAPYSTSFGVNNYTYSATNNTNSISEPHGIGFVWCTMLWDMTWALIDQYGFDPDRYTGTGGNNVAMHLVIEAMKLQPCGPGFVDGRDAILAADSALYEGANHCLIWQAFARRGLGFSADQGSNESRTDQVQAFDLPAECINIGLAEDLYHRGISVLPNPANDEVLIRLDHGFEETLLIDLLDVKGRTLSSTMVRPGSIAHTLDIAQWSAGLYVLRFRSGTFDQRERLLIVN